MEFKNEKYTIVFFQKKDDEKYSFAVKDNPEATDWLLANVKTKRVRKDKIKYAVKGIFEKLNEYSKSNNKIKLVEMENPIIKLSELCQKSYGRNIESRVVKKTGADHCPTVFVEIELPNGKIYAGSGSNQKEAKKRAAEVALEENFS